MKLKTNISQHSEAWTIAKLPLYVCVFGTYICSTTTWHVANCATQAAEPRRVPIIIHFFGPRIASLSAAAHCFTRGIPSQSSNTWAQDHLVFLVVDTYQHHSLTCNPGAIVYGKNLFGWNCIPKPFNHLQPRSNNQAQLIAQHAFLVENTCQEHQPFCNPGAMVCEVHNKLHIQLQRNTWANHSHFLSILLLRAMHTNNIQGHPGTQTCATQVLYFGLHNKPALMFTHGFVVAKPKPICNPGACQA